MESNEFGESTTDLKLMNENIYEDFPTGKVGKDTGDPLAVVNIRSLSPTFHPEKFDTFKFGEGLEGLERVPIVKLKPKRKAKKPAASKSKKKGGKRKSRRRTRRKNGCGKKKFKKHYMWNTRGKRYVAKTYKQHKRGLKLGHTHKKPKKKSRKRRR